MKLEWKTDSFAFVDLDPFVAELLRRLPGCATVEDDVVRARIFPAPTAGREEEADSDWREHVEPDLRELFASHVDRVVADLVHLKPEAKGEALTVPVAHVREWIHTLNQARLALGERHSISEQHLNHGVLPDDPQDAFAVLQVEFYGYILAFLLRHTDL